MYKFYFSFILVIMSFQTLSAEIIRDVKIIKKIGFSEQWKCNPNLYTASPNAQKLALACKDIETGKYFWTINGQKLKEYDEIRSPFFFSIDSQNYAYVALQNEKSVIGSNWIAFAANIPAVAAAYCPGYYSAHFPVYPTENFPVPSATAFLIPSHFSAVLAG